jgi:hypothetical protein
MFLPVLLVRDYGVAGWFVFAIPNIVGAAAMGWVLKTQAASRHMVERHKAACRWFSVVTILFHVYFVGAILARFVPLPLALSPIVLAGILWRYATSDRRTLRVAGAIYLLSLLAFLVTATYLGVPDWRPVHWVPAFSSRGVAWLAPVCLLGFLTCPYLDLTFHRARQSVSHDGARVAFGVGFGIFFLLMILFTLWYAPSLWAALKSPPGRGVVLWLVAIHMVVQTAFTVAAHLRELLPPVSSASGRSRAQVLLTLGSMLALATALAWLGPHDRDFRFAEAGYLLFLAAYGLLFPAYLCLTPGGRALNILAFTMVVVLAAPGYALGFFRGWTIWLVPSVALIVAVSFLTRRAHRHTLPTPAEDPSGESI